MRSPTSVSERRAVDNFSMGESYTPTLNVKGSVSVREERSILNGMSRLTQGHIRGLQSQDIKLLQKTTTELERRED